MYFHYFLSSCVPHFLRPQKQVRHWPMLQTRLRLIGQYLLSLFSLLPLLPLLLLMPVLFQSTLVKAQNQEAVQSPVPPPIVKVSVTHQGFHPRIPWQKSAIGSRNALGVLISPQEVLVTASLVQDASYIEFELPENNDKKAAKVQVVDYDVNLALLKLENPDPQYFAGLKPIAISPLVKVNQQLNVWQLNRSGDMTFSPTQVTRMMVGQYALSKSNFLLAEVNGILRSEGPTVTIPATNAEGLAGLLLRYDSRNQSATVLPSAIIQSFLKASRQQPYPGMPTIGMTVHATSDKQLTDYLGVSQLNAGIYVSEVLKGGSGYAAGVQQGDVIVAVNGKKIDKKGEYQDPNLDSISYSHLIRGLSAVGEPLEWTVWRQGKELKLTGKATSKPVSDELIPSLLPANGPNYILHGGLLFQELTMPYLESFGENWETSAPARLVQIANNPAEYERQNKRRMVILGAVIPVKAAQGYQQIGAVTVLKVNDQEITDLESVQKALAQPLDQVHKIELDTYPKVIYLDAKQALLDNQELTAGVYRIPQLSRMASP